jgi:hypothetical protein
MNTQKALEVSVGLALGAAIVALVFMVLVYV